MVRVGVDLVQVSQVAQTMQRFGRRFLDRVYTDAEVAYCMAGAGREAERLAARFAAKEATMKVLRVGDAPMSWKAIEVLRETCGACTLALHDDARLLAAHRGLREFSVSLSHEGDYAT